MSTSPGESGTPRTPAFKRLRGWEHLVWKRRLLHVTGFERLPDAWLPELPLDARLSSFEREVLDGFVLRWQLRGDQNYVTFGAVWGPSGSAEMAKPGRCRWRER